MTVIATGAKALSKKATGRIINLFKADPLVIAQITGSSRSDMNPEAFSAFTAKSSPKIPAVFFAATLLITTTSSMSVAMSSNKANNPEAMYRGDKINQLLDLYQRYPAPFKLLVFKKLAIEGRI